jgi:3-deoxy-7-phosphoheptulonate synthase
MMIMKRDATEEEIKNVIKEIKVHGLKADVSRGDFRTVIGLVGDESKVPFDNFAILPGVKEVVKIETPYKLISREYGLAADGSGGMRRTIDIGNIHIGNGEPIIMAGPCAVENKKQLFMIAEAIKKAGAHILRGGIFKPRSSVHSFQGVGGTDRKDAEQALKWMRDAGREFGLPVVTEVRGEDHVDMAAEYVDILQIGSRNMYNQDLLAKVGKKNRPILLKRHFGAGIEEFLSFADYIAAEGNKDIILCERGIVPVGKGKEYTRYIPASDHRPQPQYGAARPDLQHELRGRGCGRRRVDDRSALQPSGGHRGRPADHYTGGITGYNKSLPGDPWYGIIQGRELIRRH